MRAPALSACILPLALGIAAAGFAAPKATAAHATAADRRSLADLIAASRPSDWRTPDPDNTLYLDLASGRVIIELAPGFAPLHVANIRTLVRERYFDGLSIERAQDNFVVQWGDPDGTRPLGSAAATLPAEFTRADGKDLAFVALPDRDGYAPQVGFAQQFPAARDPRRGQAWLTHCYGMVGVGRDNAPESGSGAELYVVIGQSPRQLDRNIALVGRVLSGMELLATLPRGTEALGFYAKPAQRTPILRVRLASEIPAAERSTLQVMRTDTALFRAVVDSRRNRRDDWYVVPAGHIDLCNIPIPTREAPAP
ncbi:MAG TPA: peptidylprolyl isomerase [Steroidobacteraceae bacterium]|nr:peptidylprolyl isomerase [Steroidobacteraceae bacterium]